MLCEKKGKFFMFIFRCKKVFVVKCEEHFTTGSYDKKVRVCVKFISFWFSWLRECRVQLRFFVTGFDADVKSKYKTGQKLDKTYHCGVLYSLWVVARKTIHHTTIRLKLHQNPPSSINPKGNIKWYVSI